jgi:hypothetical protein
MDTVSVIRLAAAVLAVIFLGILVVRRKKHA